MASSRGQNPAHPNPDRLAHSGHEVLTIISPTSSSHNTVVDKSATTISSPSPTSSIAASPSVDRRPYYSGLGRNDGGTTTTPPSPALPSMKDIFNPSNHLIVDDELKLSNQLHTPSSHNHRLTHNNNNNHHEIPAGTPTKRGGFMLIVNQDDLSLRGSPSFQDTLPTNFSGPSRSRSGTGTVGRFGGSEERGGSSPEGGGAEEENSIYDPEQSISRSGRDLLPGFDHTLGVADHTPLENIAELEGRGIEEETTEGGEGVRRGEDEGKKNNNDQEIEMVPVLEQVTGTEEDWAVQ
jgi:hypothetical protein